MAKAHTSFVCQECGHESAAWLGRCPGCGAWETLIETVKDRGRGVAAIRPVSTNSAARLSEVQTSGPSRLEVPIAEFSRVLGGGIVPGSLVLISGDPGIGKSTLVLQVAGAVAESGKRVLYASGEESAGQIRLRADRLGSAEEGIFVLAETRIEDVLATAEQMNPALVIIDSIQTAQVSDLDSLAGSVAQVRECTARLMQWAKPRQCPVFLVGHVTKDGSIAGPRVLEHMVDAVLYLEGDRFQQFRILRAVKNRFGSTDEVGVFEMAEGGLQEVANPSSAFLADRPLRAPGSTVAVTVEGTRPLLVEVQALTTPSVYGLPKRSANGFDVGRLALLVAVLQKRVGLPIGSDDIYANVVGGLKISEPGADLAIAMAIASSTRERPVNSETVAIGEIGLSGEVRPVPQLDRRLIESERLGFRRAIVPRRSGEGRLRSIPGLEIVAVQSVAEAIVAALTER